MNEIALIAADKDAERRRQARCMTFTQRAEAGLVMFGLCTEAMRAGIRMTHPEFNDQQVHQAMLQRLRFARRFEAPGTC